MENSDQTLARLKQFLAPGAVSKIARKAKVSQPFVSKVLTGKTRNVRILSMLIDEAEEYKKLIDRINNL